MNKIKTTDGTTSFTRITKRAARKLYESGESIALCPVKLRPGFPFASHCEVSREREFGQTFDAVVKGFEHYNCNLFETGYYAAYYTAEDATNTVINRETHKYHLLKL